jgi:Ca2+-binding RTX toxin-like protein
MFVNGVGQGTPGGNRIFLTVWDGGGQDTYDFSNYTTDLTINLQPGEWSTTSSAQLAYLGDGHYARGNIANALLYEDNTASLIENAIGGSGSDMMIGNSTANRLEGHTGDDTLRGEAGNDTLRGGAGNDILDGGADDDILDGGTGNDIFIATPNDGNDFIYDFHQGQDLIEVKDYHYLIAPIPEDKQLKLPEKAISHLYRLYEFSNLRIEVADANSDGALDSIIHLDANNSVTAYNVSSLTAADFLFVA